MVEPSLLYFDIAAVVVMLISLTSFLVRLKTRTPAARVYISVLVLVLLACLLAFATDVLGVTGATSASRASRMAAEAAHTLYVLTWGLISPAYLVLIATVSGTSHRLNAKPAVRFLLWVPMLCQALFVALNPLHHLVLAWYGDALAPGPAWSVSSLGAAYYAIAGIIWLFRWRVVLSDDEFATLMMPYPLIGVSSMVQSWFPTIRIVTFSIAVAIMLVSAFVMRPERQTDSFVNAASASAYNDLCRRAFITERPLTLTYLEMVNLDRLRELMGKDELQDTVRQVADNIGKTLEMGDTLFYLRNGLFCICPARQNVEAVVDRSRRLHEQDAQHRRRHPQQIDPMEMRVCLVRIPKDVSDLDTLGSFVHRFSHLMPEASVSSFDELARKDDFALNMSLVRCLKHAIQNRSFEVYYQPVYCVADGKFHSAEALVRLFDPEFGQISPGLFVPEAEASGAIVEIGHILLSKICAFLSTIDFEGTGLSYVEVNLSCEQCVRPEMASEILSLLRSHHVDPSRMNVEITETSAAFSQDIIDANVRALAREGVSFSLDDYGTGYSNTMRVLSLPFTLVKFDKSFADGLEDPHSRTVCERSIRMMKEIGKQALVEGVETAEQAQAVIGMGADYIQGFHYARPMPESELVDFLKSHNA